MSEQELFLLGEARGNDEEHVQKMLKKQQVLEDAINDYQNTINELQQTANDLVEENHPERYCMFSSNIFFVFVTCKLAFNVRQIFTRS